MSPGFKEIRDAPIKRVDKDKLALCLSRHIYGDRGLTGASIIGKQQTGKSAYALTVMYELYNGNVDDVLKHTVFSIRGLANLLQNAMDNHDKMICVLWDDASVGGSASHYNTDRKLVQYLSALGDTLGIATKGLLMTSPSSDLIKAFRQYDFYKVAIGFGRHENERIARGYTRHISPYGQESFTHVYEDTFDARIPFYQKYYNMREQLSISTIANMRSLLDECDNKQQGKYVKTHRNINITDDE
jgi:hypothetical protein